MKHLKTVFLLLLFVACMIVSFNLGMLSQFMLDTTPRGALSAGMLRQLDRGDIKSVRKYLASDAEQGIYYYSIVSKSWYNSLLLSGPFLSPSRDDRNSHISSLVRVFSETPEGRSAKTGGTPLEGLDASADAVDKEERRKPIMNVMNSNLKDN